MKKTTQARHALSDARLSPLLALLLVTVPACNMDPTGSRQEDGPAAAAVSDAATDPMAAHDLDRGKALPPALADDRPRPVMQMQVVLDRLGFTPGVVDGKEGLSTRNALMGFQEANALEVTGTLDEATRQALSPWANIPATRVVTVAEGFARGPFGPLPDDPARQAKLPAMSYETLDEKLAERFHTTTETLAALNPQLIGSTAAPSPAAKASDAPAPRFRAGQKIRVPNVGGDRIETARVKDPKWRATLTMLGVGSQQPRADRIVVSKSKGTLKVYDAADKLVGMFTATMGSSRDPLPLGEWKVLGTSYNPPFHYNPELFWDVSDSDAKHLLPPGPNGPVGVAWIDLSKEHYGIHGTPEPQTIGRAQSHGCVRLTNWDVARLAQMVSSGTRVLFEA